MRRTESLKQKRFSLGKGDRARRKHGPQKLYKKLIGSERVNRGALRDFKINFTGSFVYINNGGISEYTLNSYKEYISINLW